MELRTIIVVLSLSLLLTSCANNERSDGYGQFEADKVTVSAEANGLLTTFRVEEGMQLTAGEVVGQVDSTQLSLRLRELKAGITSIQSNIAKLNAQAEVFQEQLTTAQKELQRFTALKKDNAATQQQVDQAQGQVNTLRKQIASIEVQKSSIGAEVEAAQARVAQVKDQLKKTTIINPINGRVVSAYMEQHEMVSTGKPLYQIANLENMELRVFISGAQLSGVALGQKVEVLIDASDGSLNAMSGTISWIASEAEFTPKMIQTKKERVTQVYALKVRVANPEGRLKIGMPAEVNFQ